MDDADFELDTHQPADERISPPEAFVDQANVTESTLAAELSTPEAVWRRAADLLDWQAEYDDIHDAEGGRFYPGGELNAAYNCLDRHLGTRNNQRALVWEGRDGKTRTYTYLELTREVEQCAAALSALGVEAGDVVTLHMPTIPELPIAMLACARLGAVHSVVFAGFSAAALAMRMNEAGSTVLLTCDGYYRRSGPVTLKNKADTACSQVDGTVRTVVVDRLGDEFDPVLGEDEYAYDSLIDEQAGASIEPRARAAGDELFVIYTSGTTGRPKRVTHTTGGYLAHVAWTSHAVLDLKPTDTYWSTADIGWITGHSYLVYGPLALGATVVLQEGRPEFPSKNRPWELIERHAVDVFYTAPTTVRSFMKRGAEALSAYDLSSLRLLGTVGEPITPRAWQWLYEHVGEESCPIVDTWWQTETGGHLLTTLPGVHDMKPGAVGPALPGVEATVVDGTGQAVDEGTGGYLLIESRWPGMALELVERRHWASGDDRDDIVADREWAYPTEDGAVLDEDGYVTVLGRLDDVINVAGYRFGTMELESAIVALEGVAEAAVTTGEADGERVLYAYVTPEADYDDPTSLETAVPRAVERAIGPFARPERVVVTPALPKTSSGKILRRLLTDIANDEDLGDTSSLQNPEVVGEIESAVEE